MLSESEAIVLRSYSLREADLLVSFFTRAEGKVKGVARSAKKSRRRFGGALEPLTYVRLYWEDRERAELARVDSCEILDSPLAHSIDYPRAVALGHVAEVLDELLPEREPNDAVFRLALATLQRLQAGSIWTPLTYFELWMARLTGLLPSLSECVVCTEQLGPARAFFHPMADGLLCSRDKRLASTEIAQRSRQLGLQMLRAPIESFSAMDKTAAADLRRFLVQLLERHMEKNLVTATMLDRLED
ncbi:MAG: DNA repair protein RecO [Acidobacteria bacterium]|nr:DNA repair protein RecO [Acidobacteriota bacterium]